MSNASPTVVYQSEGNRIDYTPAADVAAGDVVVQGGILGVATMPIAANALGALAISGIFKFPKATDEALAAGQAVFWNSATPKVTGTPAALPYAGVVVLAAAQTDTYVYVAINARGQMSANGVDAITGSGNVVTGLASITSVVGCLGEDAAMTGHLVTAAPHATAGTITLKVWKPTATNDCTPIAATTAKNVRWVAFGTR